MIAVQIRGPLFSHQEKWLWDDGAAEVGLTD
jgi:hypothetical protein